jgi:hypothetical protein
LFQVCHAWVRPDRRTAGGRAVRVDVGVNVGGGRVGVGDRGGALVAVRLATGRAVEDVAAAVGAMTGRVRVASTVGSGKDWVDGCTVVYEGMMVWIGQIVEIGSGVGTRTGCGTRAVTSALARRHRPSRLP